MGRRTHKKVELEATVLDASRERFRELFRRFDKVAVSFSGGKASTVCLNLALEAAHAAGRLPLDVYFWDEEAIHPETVEYVERVASRPDVALKWLCIPVQHRNACSRAEPYWYPWDPAKRHLWVRPMPASAITELAGFTPGMTIPDLAHLVYGPEHGTVADVRGLRADESLRRRRAVSQRVADNWITSGRAGYSYACSPIYDWNTVDVWTAPREFGWDYNRAYDVMALAGVAPNRQRVCPPYGEEPLGNLWLYSVCWPDLWHKMLARVEGAATAARYARTELYGFGKIALPAGLTWQQYTFRQLNLWPNEYRATIAASLQRLLAEHKSKTNRPVPEDAADRLSGLSWRFLANIAARGDLKGRRGGKVIEYARAARERSGETMEQVIAEETDDDRY